MSKFDVFLPFDKVVKSEDETNTGVITISGYASTATQDYQGESILPEGLHIEYLKSSGYIDYEHDQDQIIGVPTDNTYVDEKGLFLEAELFKNMPQVQKIMKLYDNIKENGINRQLGFSIEGSVNERDDFDESIIRDVMITGVAITTHPANPDARWEVVTKSLFANKDKISKDDGGTMLAGHDINSATVTGGAAFRTESLEGGINSMVQMIRRAKEIGLENVASTLAEQLDKNDADEDAKILFLQIFTGVSAEDASKIISITNTKNDTNNHLSHLLSGINASDDD